MPSKSPIIRRVQSYTFELVDFFELYSHVPCHSRLGDCKILHVNSIENVVTVQSIRSLEVDSYDVRQIKLRLRSTRDIRPNDKKIINNLALGASGFSGNTSDTDNGYKSYDTNGNEVEVEFGEANLSISVKKNGENIEVKDIGFIISYLIKNGFDLYGLIAKGYAIATKNIGISV